MPPEVTEPVTAVPPAPLFIPNEADPPGTHAPLHPTDIGPAVSLPMTCDTSPRAAALPPTAQEAAPGQLWRPTVASRGIARATAIATAASHMQLRALTNGTASAVWNAWAVCDYHSTATSVSTNDTNVWNAWNTVGTSATSCGCTTVIDNVVWAAWGAAAASVRQTVYRTRPTIEATPEQQARWEAERELREAADALRRAEYEAARPIREAAERQRQEEFRVADEKRKAAQAIADRRAKKLLIECLSPEQRDTLEKHDYFDVKVPSGQVYRIHKGWSHNVKRVKPDGTVDRGTFCAHPCDVVPHYDNMLAQKFTLETDEAAFLRIANRG